MATGGLTCPEQGLHEHGNRSFEIAITDHGYVQRILDALLVKQRSLGTAKIDELIQKKLINLFHYLLFAASEHDRRSFRILV